MISVMSHLLEAWFSSLCIVPGVHKLLSSITFLLNPPIPTWLQSKVRVQYKDLCLTETRFARPHSLMTACSLSLLIGQSVTEASLIYVVTRVDCGCSCTPSPSSHSHSPRPHPLSQYRASQARNLYVPFLHSYKISSRVNRVENTSRKCPPTSPLNYITMETLFFGCGRHTILSTIVLEELPVPTLTIQNLSSLRQRLVLIATTPQVL